MKTPTLLLVAAGAAVLGGAATATFLHRGAPAAPSVAATSVAAPAPSPALTALAAAAKTDSLPGTDSTAPTAAPVDRAPADPTTTALATAVDAVTSSQVPFPQKQAMWNQLRTSGRLDEVTASLEQLAAENPRDAQIRTALGQAQLQKLRLALETGGDPSDVPILGMQADRYFNQALALDPTQWEAQFVKAAAMSHWPPELNKQPEVIQRLTNLAAQQETAAPQPEFAQTYLLLAQQYKTAGQPEKALQTLQSGLMKFPANPAFAQLIANAGHP